MLPLATGNCHYLPAFNFAPEILRMNTRILLFGATATLLAACSSPATEGQGETKDSTSTSQTAPAVKHYGDSITADGALAITDFATATVGKDSLDAKVDCEIITSCQKKGCWMTVKMPDGEPMRVSFKDYGFFVPTEGLEGKHAVIQGRAVKEVTDVAALQHYAEDAGKTPEEIAKITEPEISWNFTADGVIIRD